MCQQPIKRQIKLNKRVPSNIWVGMYSKCVFERQTSERDTESGQMCMSDSDLTLMGRDWHNQILLTKLKDVLDVIVLFYMSSNFIVVVDILGCNFIVTDLILHLHICTTALGKSMFCFNKMFPGVDVVVVVRCFFFRGQKRIVATFFLCR